MPEMHTLMFYEGIAERAGNILGTDRGEQVQAPECRSCTSFSSPSFESCLNLLI
jgi:hypothetical protein